MEKIECGEFGYFEFTKPNIPEAMELISRVSANTAGYDGDVTNYITAKCVSHMGKLVKNIKIKIADKEISSYEKMLDEYDLIKYILEMANTVLECLELSLKKKAG